jgi:YidC/Oxa1 family membrane protein insertase
MDRRVIGAILLMMAIAVVPSFFLKTPPKPVAAVAPSAASPSVGPSVAALPSPVLSAVTARTAGDSVDAPTVLAEDTVLIRTPLVTYGLSTRGARLVQAAIATYPSLALADSGTPADLVPAGSSLFGAKLVTGRDTLPLDRWDFVPSATAVDATTGPASVTFTGSRDGVVVTLTYTVPADDYRLDVAGTITGLGAPGATLLLDLGHGIRETEKDVAENQRAAALVTKPVVGDAERHDFSSLDSAETQTYDGQFEWVAMKSKYFVTAVFAFDSTKGRLSGARMTAVGEDEERRAPSTTSLSVQADGAIAFGAYVGPMEYKRLTAIGHDFDDVNPYGWPGFRGMIRFFSTPVRWLLLQMHETANVPWGLALVLFGVLIRLLLWPLNQKAMRSSMEMQAIQPMIQDLQAKYKNDPQKLSQKQMELFKEHKVNPLGGCLPMLLPWPVMLALFFVFQNTIELRGAPFLWLPDLSMKDPFFIVPVLMGASMWATMKIGAIGTPPNDQQKMMTTIMPVMMTVMFSSFASGLNLYYTVQNIVSIPQQWLLLKERRRRGLVAAVAAKTPPPTVSKKK